MPASPKSTKSTDSKPTLKSALSTISFGSTDAHDLPWYVIWTITFAIPFGIALVNYAMVWADTNLVALKFTTVQKVMQSSGAFQGTLVLVAFAACYSGIASALVTKIAPLCAGSGIPEAKSFYNGNYIPGLFRFKGFGVRVVGVVLATAAGFPIGREGPMVCIGGAIGYAVVHFLAKPFHSRMVKLGVSDGGDVLGAVMLEEDRFAFAKRVGCAMGSAAGIATAFNAPIGGILYILEEVTVTSWPPELTFRTFVVTTCAVMISRGLLNVSHADFHKLLIYQREYTGSREWQWIDLPFFIILAFVVGIASAVFTQALSFVWSVRKRHALVLRRFHPFGKIAECVCYASVVAFAFGLIPNFVSCHTIPHALLEHGGEGELHHTQSHHHDHGGGALHHTQSHDHGEGTLHHIHTIGNNSREHDLSHTSVGSHDGDHVMTAGGAEGHRRLSAGHHLNYVQYTCEEGSYNNVATLLLSGAESAIKHLYSRHSHELTISSLVFCLLTYVPLAMGMPGLAVPMGCFVPCMLIGSLIGRLVGEWVKIEGLQLADAGVYAMVGSAGMLGGFTHMTIAIIVLLVEASHDLSLISPLMLSIFIARIAKGLLVEHDYADILIEKKQIPFLEADLPEVLDNRAALAWDVCEALPSDAVLPPEAAPAEIRRALNNHKDIIDFPVLDGGEPIGLTTRARLQAALAVYDKTFIDTVYIEKHQCDVDEADVVGMTKSRGLADMMMARELGTSPVIKRLVGDDPSTISVDRIMDPTPFIIFEDMPAHRFYPLFAQAHAGVALVVSKKGVFRGLLSRANITSYLHHHEHSGHHTPQHYLSWNHRMDRNHSPVCYDERQQGVDSMPARESVYTYKKQMPTHIFIVILGGIPLAVACTNYVMTIVDTTLVTWKFTTLQEVIDSGGVAAGAVTLACICACLATTSSFLVATVAPTCAGSGIPEAKGYLNGSRIPELFAIRTTVVRVICIVLSVAAGFPVGREGPMICIGGSIGYCVVHMLVTPIFRAWILDHASIHGPSSPMLVAMEEQFIAMKRHGCILGAAAGIATAFNAPIGGILYLFEEVTVTNWSGDLTYRAFVCSVLAVLFSRGLLNIFDMDVHRLVIWENSPVRDVLWEWIDTPFVFLLAACTGFTSAFMTRVLLKIWACRKRRAERLIKFQPLAKILEVLVYATICALLFALVPTVAHCDEEAHGSHSVAGHSPTHTEGHEHASGHARRLSTHLVFRRHACEPGYTNEVASLLLSGAESAVKHLFARNAYTLHLWDLLLALVTYGTLTLGMPGLCVPMGLFVPNMLIGALLGRLVGQVLAYSGIGTAHAGIYALVGSAGMLGGFTHMTVAIVALLVEACYDLSLVAPIMLSVFVSHICSKLINHHAYDEVLILKKGVPFLDAELPEELDNSSTTVDQLCNELPEAALLPIQATVRQAQEALNLSELLNFIVVDDGMCVGIITRTRLEIALRSFQQQSTSDFERAQRHSPNFSQRVQDVFKVKRHLEVMQSQGKKSEYDVISHDSSLFGIDVEDKELRINSIVKQAFKGSTDVISEMSEDLIPLHKVMDPAPFTLFADMPVRRCYMLFTKVGITAAFVMSKDGNFCGILTRRNLIRRSREVLMEHDSSSHSQSCPLSHSSSVTKLRDRTGSKNLLREETENDGVKIEDIVPELQDVPLTSEDDEGQVDEPSQPGKYRRAVLRAMCCLPSGFDMRSAQYKQRTSPRTRVSFGKPDSFLDPA